MDEALRREVVDRLHDGPVQALTAAQLQLEVLASMAPQLPPAAVTAADAAAAAVASATAACRQLVERLRDVADP